MQKGRFLSRVLTENSKFNSSMSKKYLKPIANIQENILSEARKGKYSLEVSRHLEGPICDFFRDEGFIISKESDPDTTEIFWSSVKTKY